MKCTLYTAGLLLGLVACHSQTQPATEAANTPTATTQAAYSQNVITNSPGSSYRVYRGLLPGQADSITLHLTTAPQPRYDNHGPNTQGSYYGSDGHPYELASQPSTPDSLVLNDFSPEHGAGPNGQAPTWRLKQQPGGTLAGTIGGQAVRLRPTAPAGGLTFAVRYFADSLAAYPKDAAQSPKARIYLQALAPVGNVASLSTLQTSLLRSLRGDTLGSLPLLQLPALFKQQRDSFYKEYRDDITEILATTSPNERPSATLNYEDQTSTAVLYHQGKLLSLGFFSYTYLGGAHGMNTTIAASYDLRTGRRLRYDDIFLPSATAQLPALLGQAVRPLVGLKPAEPLDEQLFVKQMPVTNNVFLTAGGVEFIYQPYEIASYAQGEVRVFLPLAQVRSLLREGLPLPGSGGVAAR